MTDEGEWRVTRGVDGRMDCKESMEEASDGEREGAGEGVCRVTRVEVGGGETVERREEVCEWEGEGGGEGAEKVGEGGGVGVEKELGKSGKREKEKGEWGDTCALVFSSSVFLGVSASGWRDERGECWSGPGRWLSWLLSPEGLLTENPEAWCVCVVWSYPEWRADESVFSPS